MKVAEKLVRHYKGRGRTAEALGVTRETIRLWLLKGIPLERSLYVEEKTDGLITADEILREARRAA